MSSAVISDADQSAVVAFLESGAAFGGRPVERIDTHISHVFLAGDRAYKMKRAVKLDFLDYSTLALRHHFCKREIEANRVMAPDLYLGLAPVVRVDGGFRLGGPGQPAEWLVEMARFDRSTQFDQLVRRGELSVALVEDLADRVALAHARCERRPDQSPARQFRFFRTYIGRILLRQRGDERDTSDARRWVVLVKQAIRQHAEALGARRRQGFVRHIHGDMHLANICLVDGRPTPFDAIEFSDEIASGDVLYDIAFPIMDLLHHGRRDLANRLINRYLALTRDYGGLRLLPLFLSFRAVIRAMAAALGPPSDGRIRQVERLERLAMSFLDHAPRPRLIALGGLSGSGKSTLAAALASEIGDGWGAVLLRSDVIRKRDYGVALDAHLGTDAYRPAAREQVYVEMLECAEQALAAGLTVILDATFLDDGDRATAKALADRAHGADFVGLWLDAPLATLRHRLIRRGQDASDATVDVLERQAQRDLANLTWVKADVSGSVDQSLCNIRAALLPAD
ncbi:MAG: AAA family ATPase [Pseudomonadota bacterium]